MRNTHLLVAMLAAVLMLGACSSTPSLDPRRWFSKDETPAPKASETPGVEARLRPVGSPVTGAVRLRESGDLLIAQIDLAGARPGAYRIMLHATGNCSSPNAFSAGPPWSPPGWKEAPARLIPEAYAGGQSILQLTARVRGVRLGDALNRSVLVYEGITPQVPQPDVPNNVVACGVFEQSKSLF
jgi:hypothetical protein